MNFESIKKFVENNGDSVNLHGKSTVDSMPRGFIDPIVMQGLKIDRIEGGRIICSFTVPDRLVSDDNSLDCGALATLVDLVGGSVVPTLTSSSDSGLSVEINVSYFNRAYRGEEIEIDTRALRVGEALSAVSVEFKSKKTGKIIAQGRHTLYKAVPSKL